MTEHMDAKLRRAKKISSVECMWREQINDLEILCSNQLVKIAKFQFAFWTLHCAQSRTFAKQFIFRIFQGRIWPTLEHTHFEHSVINIQLNSLHDKCNYSFSLGISAQHWLQTCKIQKKIQRLWIFLSFVSWIMTRDDKKNVWIYCTM